MKRVALLVAVCVSPALPALYAQDSPHLRGPHGDGTYPDALLRTDWQEKPPTVLWRKDVGYGFSAVAVAGTRTVTAGYLPDNGKSVLYCLDTETGRELWQQEYEDTCGGPRGGLSGPIATPAIDGTSVYMVASMGALYCFDLNTGARRWELITNKDKDLGVPHGEFGDGASPVILGDLILVHLSTTTNSAAWYAIRKQSHEVAWSHPVEKREANRKTADRAYSPAVPCTVNGKAHVILISNAAIDCVDLQTATRAWTHSLADLKMTYGPFPEPVLFAPDRFFLGLWYSLRGTAVVFQMKPDGLTRLWSENSIGKGAYSYVVRNGFVYGYGAAGLYCVELETGKVKWKWRSEVPSLVKDQGEVILLGDTLLWISSSGMLYAGEASPDRPGPIAAFKAISPCRKPLGQDKARYNNVVSTSPVFAGGRIYCRSGWGELVCVDFGGKAQP